MSTPFDVELFQENIHDLSLEEDEFLWVTSNGYDTWEEILEDHQAIDEPSFYLQLGALANACMEEEGGAGEYDAEDLGDDTFFHHGDLFVDGHILVTSGFLVTGDLHVNGSITDLGPDSLVLVMGDIYTKHVYTTGEFHVQGDIQASDGIVYATNKQTSLVAESIYARIVIEDEHDVQTTIIDAEFYFDNHSDRYSIAEELEDILIPEVYDDDGLINPELMFEIIRNGDPVFIEDE